MHPHPALRTRSRSAAVPALAALALLHVALALAGAAGCRSGAADDATAPAAAAGGAEALAPVPFPAERIRTATDAGRTYVFAVTTPDGQTAQRRLRFTAVDAEGGTLESALLGPDGAPFGEPQARRVTWTELEGHAHFPAAATTVTEESVTVPAGRFDATVYTVREEGKVSRYWFAKDLPGAPVRMVEESAAAAGEAPQRFTMELVSHTPGTR